MVFDWPCKRCYNREDIQKYNRSQNAQCIRQVKQHCAEHGFRHLAQEADVYQQDSNDGQNPQPDKQRLEKIFAQSPEKCFYRPVVIAFDSPQHTMVQCAKCRADGYNWQAADGK